MEHIPKPAPFFALDNEQTFKRSGNNRIGILHNYVVEDQYTFSTYETRAEAEKHYANSCMIDARMAAEKDKGDF